MIEKTFLFWVRLGKSMGRRPISSPQGIEIEFWENAVLGSKH